MILKYVAGNVMVFLFISLKFEQLKQGGLKKYLVQTFSPATYRFSTSCSILWTHRASQEADLFVLNEYLHTEAYQPTKRRK